MREVVWSAAPERSRGHLRFDRYEGIDRYLCLIDSASLDGAPYRGGVHVEDHQASATADGGEDARKAHKTDDRRKGGGG
jgi:hypothetical protein